MRTLRVAALVMLAVRTLAAKRYCVSAGAAIGSETFGGAQTPFFQVP